MLLAGDQWTFAGWMAIFLQTCDKSCSPPLWGEKKYASRWGPVNICSLDGYIPADVWQKLKNLQKVRKTWKFKNKNMLFAGDQWTFAIHLPRCDSNFCHTSALIMQFILQMFTGPQRKAYFFSSHKGGEQFMSHVCRNNANLFENVVGLHWNAWSHFRSQNETLTFVTRLHE